MSLHTSSRPQKFADVLGQDHILKSLEKVVKDRRAKSFIFTGPSGVGKTTLARILANEFADGKATAANRIEIDAAKYSGVNEIEAVVTRTYSRALGASPSKMVIIDECHALSAQAWKVLLKPIEEPLPHVYWALCTTEAGKIPKTIQTRCVRYDLKSVGEDDILALILKVLDDTGLNPLDEVIEAVVEGAAGSPRQALTYLEACLNCASAADARAIMRSGGQTKEVIDLCRFLAKGQGQSWAEAMKILKLLEGTEAESIRIVVTNYFAAAALGAKSDKQARHFLGILECFSTTYNPTDRYGPLLRSLGLVLGLDQ